MSILASLRLHYMHCGWFTYGKPSRHVNDEMTEIEKRKRLTTIITLWIRHSKIRLTWTKLWVHIHHVWMTVDPNANRAIKYVPKLNSVSAGINRKVRRIEKAWSLSSPPWETKAFYCRGTGTPEGTRQALGFYCNHGDVWRAWILLCHCPGCCPAAKT